MTGQGHDIRQLDALALEAHLEDLCRILMDSVDGGAAISFMAPLARWEALRFWRDDVRAAVAQGETVLFGAYVCGRLTGVVQLVIAMPPNQPHRAVIAKMIVHPDGRRLGLGTALMTAALDRARDIGKTLVTLDTRTGDVSEKLYRGVGFEQAGIIPDYAFNPDGQARHATTYMYCYL